MKGANMPVYQLLGGKCHHAIDCYEHTGGITPAMKVARLGEAFNLLTAWHRLGAVLPVGHAANGHIDLAVWNFGIQESLNI